MTAAGTYVIVDLLGLLARLAEDLHGLEDLDAARVVELGASHVLRAADGDDGLLGRRHQDHRVERRDRQLPASRTPETQRRQFPPLSPKCLLCVSKLAFLTRCT